MRRRRLSNTVGFDDAPFPRDHRGRVAVVGAVFADRRFDGVVVGSVDKDGDDAAEAVVATVEGSQFREHVQLVLLQGVAFAGFNVVDVFAVHERLGIPVLVVARRRPDPVSIRRSLLERVPDGARKWELIERLGPMESVAHVWVQRVGLTREEAESVVARLALHGHMPEPLRAAHLIAGALVDGTSRGRA